VSVDLALTISDIDLVLGRAGKDVAFGADAPGQAQDMTLAEGRYDVTDLAQGMRSVDVSALLVQPGASLGGSGAMSAQVINQGTLAPGYSPGVLDLTNGLVSGSDSVLQIELGGNTPGDRERLSRSGHCFGRWRVAGRPVAGEPVGWLRAAGWRCIHLPHL